MARKKVIFGNTYKTKFGTEFIPVACEEGKRVINRVIYCSPNTRKMGRYVDKEGNRIKSCNLIKP